MLYLEYMLDFNDSNGEPTGNAVLIVKHGEHHVVDVGMCEITEDSIENLLNVFRKEHDWVHVKENDASALFDYEFLCLELQNKLEKAQLEVAH